MAIKFSNNAKTTVSSAVSTTDTSISVADASDFPTLGAGDYTYATLAELSTPANLEIVKVTAISGNTLTVVRAQQSTTARSFSSGDACELRVTAGLVEEAIDEKAEITVSETAPSNPSAGSLWFDPSTVETFIYYSDGNSNQWVQTNPTSGGVIGSGGGSGQGVTVYATINDLPLTGVTEGAMALVDATDKLYIYSDTGWYSIAIVNTSPTISGVASSYTLSTNGSATVVTVTATDPEGFPLTYSIVSDTSGNTATVTQGTGSNTNQWTITPSTNSAHAGEFTLVFRASDGTNIASASSTFSLVFSLVNSKYTKALITSVGANNAANNSFDDLSSNNHTITANGNVTQGTFSPYRHGGYSSFYQATVAEYHSSTTPALGSSGWTIEGWFYRTGGAGSGIQVAGHIGAINSSTGCAWGFNGGTYIVFRAAGTTDSSFSISDATNTWVHIAFVYDGTDLECFVNGSSVGTATRSLNITDTSVTVGYGNTNFSYEGYITDLRLSSTARSISEAPDERLSADANTEFLLDHRTLTDLSSNSASVSTTGTIDQESWSPFDHSGYTAASHGGSMHFDGSGDYLVTGADADQFVNSSNTGTIEMWLRLDAFTSPRTTLCGHWTGSSGWTFDLDTAGSFVIATNGVVTSATSTGLTLGRWHHFAVVNTGSAINVFVDGIYKSTQSNPSVGSASSSSLTVGSRSDNSLPTNGIIADFRFVDGTVVYDRGSASVGDKVFTPPTAPLTAITNTALLLRGTDAAIIDKSQSVETITLNGDVKSSTAEYKHLTSSIYFDGTGDYFDTEFPALGTGDFTIEFWINPSTINSNYKALIDTRFNNANNPLVWIKNTNVIYFYAGADRINGTTTLTAGTWYHVALVRNSGTTTLYVDGSSEGTYTDSLNYTEDTVRFGQRYTSTAYNYHGYLSDFRITKGLARYTSAFTPPSSALEG